MSLPLPNAADGLYTGIVTGLLSLLLWWLQKRSTGPARKDAWQKQADALRTELRRVYEGQIHYLQGQLQGANAANERKDTEIARLNRLLTQPRSSDD